MSTGIRDLLPSVPCPTLGSALLSLATPLIKDTASEVGGSSYSNVHQMADLKPSTVAPGGRRLHLGEGMPLERMMETQWRWGVLLRKGPLASVGTKHRTHLTYQTTYGAIPKWDHLGRRAGVPESMCGK